jgi:hypothetical protein
VVWLASISMFMTWREFIFEEYRMKMSFWWAVKICSLRYLFRRLVARETYCFVFSSPEYTP